MAEVDSFAWRDHRLVYEVHGGGPRVLVFLHGLLLDSALNRRLAALLARRGHRVILLELLGHGRSDRPRHAYSHRLELWAEQTVALLDHLELDQAVVGGVSLGANVALQVAVERPERLRALVAEMPVLERGALVGASLFLPPVVILRYAPQALRPFAALARRLPDTGGVVDSFVSVLRSHPRELTAVVHGLFAGPIGPPPHLRRSIRVPTLVLGHGYDLLHPLDDAEALAREVPGATFLRTRSVVEARTRPERVVEELDRFLGAVWAPQPVASSPHSAR